MELLKLFEKSIYSLRKNGIKTTYQKINNYFMTTRRTDKDYDLFLKERLHSDKEIRRQKKLSANFQCTPLISIVVPVYNTNPIYLREMINSVRGQTYEQWELCLADGNSTSLKTKKELEKLEDTDNRIKVIFLSENKSISENTNEAIKIASGDFVALLDHDDILEPHALFEVVSMINVKPNADFIYSDEDKLDTETGKLYSPHFKPDFAPTTLRSHNYICHFTVIKKSLLKEVGFLRKEFDGSQDYDLFLRATDAALCICHIPKILYHWRVHNESTAENALAKPYAFEAARRAIKSNYKDKGLDVLVEYAESNGNYHVTFNHNQVIEPITIIIRGYVPVNEILSNFNNFTDYYKCITEVMVLCSEDKKEEYNGVTIYYLSFNSNEDEHIFIANKSKNDLLVVIDSNIEILSQNWISEVCGYLKNDKVGVIGGIVFDPNMRVYNAGYSINKEGLVVPYEGHVSGTQGYFCRLCLVQNVMAVSALFYATRVSFIKSHYSNMNEYENFRHIGFCLSSQNYKQILFNPFIKLKIINIKNLELDTSSDKFDLHLTKGIIDPYCNLNLNASDYTIYLSKKDSGFREIDLLKGVDSQSMQPLGEITKDTKFYQTVNFDKVLDVKGISLLFASYNRINTSGVSIVIRSGEDIIKNINLKHLPDNEYKWIYFGKSHSINSISIEISSLDAKEGNSYTVWTMKNSSGLKIENTFDSSKVIIFKLLAKDFNK